jgi:light-regulated signal transduction histidine kinase (bacteriophytochrome)
MNMKDQELDSQLPRGSASAGGVIWAESQPGEGATFYFILPNDRIKPSF